MEREMPVKNLSDNEMEKDVVDNLQRFLQKAGPKEGPKERIKPKNRVIFEEDLPQNQELFQNIEQEDDEVEEPHPEEDQPEYINAAFRKEEETEGFEFTNSKKHFKDRKPKAKSKNPLSQYFREPGIYTKLPSQGNFNQGEIDFTVNGEVGIYPMTAKDEIWFKNPDALLNGDAIEKVLSSCCPDISNIRDLPINDINVLLLGLRYSSFGKLLQLKTKCPKCKTENVFAVDIDDLLQNISFLEPEYPHVLPNGIKVYLKPYSYDCMVKATMVTFEEAKILQVIQKQEISEKERKELITRSFSNIQDLSIYLMARSVIKVITPDKQTVTDIDYIGEWLSKIDRQIFTSLRDKFDEINAVGVPKNYHVICQNEACKHEFPVEISYDPASFFE
jgi:hypothetical protein